jgi:PAS domain S-box-containing protein
MSKMTTIEMPPTGESLTTSKAALKELADLKFALDQHAIVAMTDVQGTITYVNDKFCAISQYSKAELIGQNHRILNSGHHPKEFFQQMYHTIASGKVWHGEIKNRAKDASIYWVDTTIVPFMNADGRPSQYVAIRADITKRKLAEGHLAQVESRYRGLLEAAPDAMVVVNQGGEIVLLNVQAEKQFGYRRDELVGQQVKDIIPEGFAERLIADATRSVADALAQQIGTGIEISGRRKDGTEFPIEIMLSPLESAEGILVTAAIRNISARKKSEQELARANRVLERSNIELQQFAYIASHDLQSPLRSISGFVQLLKMEYEGKLGEQAADWIRRTVQSIDHMQTLIRDLLAYSRVDSRSRPFVQISFLDVFSDVIDLLESSIRDAGAQVTSGELPVVMGDRSQLVQLMQNLIGNGLKYHGDKSPHVHVSAKRNGNEWTFSVQDNGIGIDPKYYERIFEIFKRLHDQKEYPGTGIGLAVCRRVVNRHGGTIWVESEPGHGSTFHFTIPEGTAPANDQQTYQ